MNTGILGFGIGLLVVVGTSIMHENELETLHDDKALMQSQISQKEHAIQRLTEELVEEQEATRWWMKYSEDCADQDERERRYQDRFDRMLAACRQSVKEEGCLE